ncbi:MAG: methionine/alanine import family NSS transporter small subunit [Nitriliruptoraceae bacterium]
MSTSAVVTMVIGIVAIWGGLAASITLTLRRSRARRPGV